MSVLVSFLLGLTNLIIGWTDNSILFLPLFRKKDIMIKDNRQKIVLACTGASGMLYARLLINKLIESDCVVSLALVLSNNAVEIWQSELNEPYIPNNPKVTLYQENDFKAPFASGSSQYNSMIVCPASMGTLARIANGISDCLISRAADVMLKERRRLIIVPRETPYNLIHIRNMEQITLAGGTICPATPSYYSNPQTIEQLAMTVVDRIIDLAAISNNTFRWGENF